jgi:hypothetical protein
MDYEEPTLETDDALKDVHEEVEAREPIFHHPEFGADRDALEAMTDPEFWEVGASGRRYSREFCIETTLERYVSKDNEEDWETRDFHCRRLGEDIYLATYTLVEEGSRVTRRSSIWRRGEEQWVVVYHQGTLVEDE